MTQDSDSNPYQPPNPATLDNPTLGLSSLLQSTANHHLLLGMFALVYIGAAATVLIANDDMAFRVILALSVWLMVTTWMMLYAACPTWQRLLLSLGAALPMVNLLVPVINHIKLSDISREHDIAVTSFGPVVREIEQRLSDH